MLAEFAASGYIKRQIRYSLVAYRNGSSHNTSASAARRVPASQRSSILNVRGSTVHGRGVFATQTIVKGARIIEYTGKRMPWSDVPEDDDPHTFLFSIDNGQVINAAIDGNEARWINHSCDPNCEAVGEGDRIFIYALRDIEPGEELFYDYSLELDEPLTKKLLREYRCHCRTPPCRGTLLDV